MTTPIQPGDDQNLPQQPQAPQEPQAAQQPQYQQPQYQQNRYQQAMAYGEPGVGEPFDGAASPDDLTRPLYGATFGQAIRRYFKNYVNFKGRASRSEYWWVQLFLALVYLLPTALYFVGLMLTIGAAAMSSSYDDSGYLVESGGTEMFGPGLAVVIISGILMGLMGLATLLPSLGLVWRRLHDANFAGPFYFLTFTYIGGIVVLVFTILGPKPEGRRFDQR